MWQKFTRISQYWIEITLAIWKTWTFPIHFTYSSTWRLYRTLQNMPSIYLLQKKCREHNNGAFQVWCVSCTSTSGCFWLKNLATLIFLISRKLASCLNNSHLNKKLNFAISTRKTSSASIDPVVAAQYTQRILKTFVKKNIRCDELLTSYPITRMFGVVIWSRI